MQHRAMVGLDIGNRLVGAPGLERWLVAILSAFAAVLAVGPVALRLAATFAASL